MGKENVFKKDKACFTVFSFVSSFEPSQLTVLLQGIHMDHGP